MSKRHSIVALLAVVALGLLAGGIALRGRARSLEWATVTPGGDCRCADGSAFNFWERRADPHRVVLFLNGGGVCWDATSCAFTGDHGESDFYDWSSRGAEPENRHGMFDVTRGDNPFAEFSYLYVSSCTGDAHLGNVAQAYTPQLTVQHRGSVNGTAALHYLAEHYPGATEVVVVGKTAGSVAAPIYGGLVADLLPKARVTVFGAQSGAWPDHPDLNAGVLDARWGAYRAAPGWAVDGLAARDWAVPRFWAQAGRHNPKLVLGRFDFAYDAHAASEVTRWATGDTLAVITANEAATEATGVRLHSYTAPGDGHGLFEFDTFYTIKVNGVRLVTWLSDLTGARPPADVRCDRCAP
jgi:hypothetical protein